MPQHTQSSQRLSHREQALSPLPTPEEANRALRPAPAFLMPIADVKSRRTLAGRPIQRPGEKEEGDLKSTPNFSYALSDPKIDSLPYIYNEAGYAISVCGIETQR